MRSRYRSASSRGEMSFARTRAASSSAGAKASSSNGLALDAAAPPACALGQDLLGDRLGVGRELLGVLAGDRQVHFALENLSDVLGGDVRRLLRGAVHDREPVEDVGVVVAGDLVDAA